VIQWGEGLLKTDGIGVDGEEFDRLCDFSSRHVSSNTSILREAMDYIINKYRLATGPDSPCAWLETVGEVKRTDVVVRELWDEVVGTLFCCYVFGYGCLVLVAHGIERLHFVFCRLEGGARMEGVSYLERE
jgi:hypothetical protein